MNKRTNYNASKFQEQINRTLTEADEDKTAITAMIKALELRKKAIELRIKKLKDQLRDI